MLKPEGQPERARSHGRRWALLLLLPPVALLTWALIGIKVAWLGWYLDTSWIEQPSPPLTEPQFNEGIPHFPTARQLVVPIGGRIFVAYFEWPRR